MRKSNESEKTGLIDIEVLESLNYDHKVVLASVIRGCDFRIDQWCFRLKY